MDLNTPDILRLLGLVSGRAVFGRLQRFDAPAAPSDSIRVGVWDRFATFGDGESGLKVKDGDPVEFTPETFAEMVRNWYARGGRLPMCLDHRSALQGLVEAPAAAWYDALAVVGGSKVQEFKKLAASRAELPDVEVLRGLVAKFATEEDPAPTPDGLWGWRSEVTPKGEHPTEGLRNYAGISPFFVMEGRDEQERPIGPVLFDVAAVNVQFQAGCELTLGRLGGSTAMQMSQWSDLARKHAAVSVDETGPWSGAKFASKDAADRFADDVEAGIGRRPRVAQSPMDSTKWWAEIKLAAGVGDGTTMAVDPEAIKVGDTVRADRALEQPSWGRQKVPQGTTGRVAQVSTDGGYYSYEIQWATGITNWLWHRHLGEDISKMGGAPHALARSDIKIEKTGSGKWRVFVEKEGGGGFQVVGEYGSEQEAKDAAERAPARGFAMSAVADYWIKKISANVDDFYANRISYEEFSRRARAIWDQVPDSALDEVRTRVGRESGGGHQMASTARSLHAGDVQVGDAVQTSEGARGKVVSVDSDGRGCVVEVNGQRVNYDIRPDGTLVAYGALRMSTSMVSDARGQLFAPGEKVQTPDGVGYVSRVEANGSGGGKATVWFEGRTPERTYDAKQITVFSAIPGASGAFGGVMNEELFKKLGIAPDAPVADKMARYAAFAAGDATPDEITAMAADLEASGDDKAKGCASRLRRMAGVPGGEPDGDERQQFARLAAELNLPAGAPRTVVLGALSARLRSGGGGAVDEAAIERIVEKRFAERERQQREADGARTAEQLFARATAVGFDEKAKAGFMGMARANLADAEGFVVSLERRVKGRLTMGGAPIVASGAGGGATRFKPTPQAGAAPDADDSPYMHEEFAQKAADLLVRAKTDAKLMSRIEKRAGKGAHPGTLLAVAQQIVAEDEPDLVQWAQPNRDLFGLPQ